MPMHNPVTMGISARMTTSATTDAVSPMADPMERSISPVISTTVKPAAMIEIGAACSRMLRMLL